MVKTEGFGINALPFKFGCPTGAVRFMMILVTLNPANPFKPVFSLAIFIHDVVGERT
jgi:hypothetical protein